jgi:hypothetical protein
MHSRYLTPCTKTLVMSPAEMGRYIMTWTDFRVSQFPNDRDRDSPCNVSLLIIQSSDVAARPRMIYLI